MTASNTHRPTSTLAASATSRSAVASGFAVVIILLVALIGVAALQMGRLNEDLRHIAQERNLKTDLIFSLRNIARERTLSMFALSAMDEPFAVDEEFMRFTQLAPDFIVLREQLESMALSSEERALLEQAKELIRTTAPLQQDIVDRMVDGRTVGLAKLIREDVRLEKALLRIFDQMIDVQRGATAKAVDAAADAYRYGMNTVVGLGISATLLALGTMGLVLRRTARIEGELFEEKELARITLEAIGDAVITTDDQGCVSYLNPVAEHLTGWSNEQALGKPLTEVYQTVTEETRQPVEHPAHALTLDAQAVPLHRHSLLIARDAREYLVEDKASPIHSRDGKTVGSAVVFRDISEAKSFERQLSYQARHDALTGLANRREFEARLATMLSDAHADGTQQALLYLDLDQFKVVNDACGHSAGDELLRQVSMLLENKIRKSDTLARLGGDEFGVLLSGCNLERARAIGETLRNTIDEYRFAWQQRVFRVGVSIGVVPIDQNSGDGSQVMAAADAACYIAKERGRNRIWVHEPGDSIVKERRSELQWVTRLEEALSQERLQVFSQAAHSLSEPAAGYVYREFLLRLVTDDGELVSPSTFIPPAERYQTMSRLDRWMLTKVVELLAGHARDEREVYAINLSAQSLADEQFLGDTLTLLKGHDDLTPHLCFEITETAAISNWRQAVRFMEELQNLGCRFAIDDFGSGMTSFPYLRQLPVDFVKIDGAIVTDISSDPIDRMMADTINKIAHELGMLTIAEYVESERVLDTVRTLGVDFAQGFLFERPQRWTGGRIEQGVSKATRS